MWYVVWYEPPPFDFWIMRGTSWMSGLSSLLSTAKRSLLTPKKTGFKSCGFTYHLGCSLNIWIALNHGSTPIRSIPQWQHQRCWCQFSSKGNSPLMQHISHISNRFKSCRPLMIPPIVLRTMVCHNHYTAYSQTSSWNVGHWKLLHSNQREWGWSIVS